MKKILITGSRNITSIDQNKINLVLTNNIRTSKVFNLNDILIHGGAIGVDSTASMWAKSNNVKEIIIRPINPNNKSYYLHRNVEMITMCDKVIAFWDGESRGTKFTIDYAKARGKEVNIVMLNGK